MSETTPGFAERCGQVRSTARMAMSAAEKLGDDDRRRRDQAILLTTGEQIALDRVLSVAPLELISAATMLMVLGTAKLPQHQRFSARFVKIAQGAQSPDAPPRRHDRAHRGLPRCGRTEAAETEAEVSEPRWKATERRIAAKLGGVRIPVTGDRAGADVDAGPFVYQVKSRRGLPSYLHDWLSGIREAARKRGPATTGVVVWREPGAGRDDDDAAIVVLSFRDWRALHGK